MVVLKIPTESISYVSHLKWHNESKPTRVKSKKEGANGRKYRAEQARSRVHNCQPDAHVREIVDYKLLNFKELSQRNQNSCDKLFSI